MATTLYKDNHSHQTILVISEKAAAHFNGSQWLYVTIEEAESLINELLEDGYTEEKPPVKPNQRYIDMY